MTQAVELISAHTMTNLVSAINTFLAAQPLTLAVHALTITAHDLARFTGVEYRCEIAYDDTAGDTLAAPLTVAAYEDEQLPILQQTVNAAIAAAPAELWFPLPLLVADTPRRLNKNIAVFIRNASPAAINNIGFSEPGARVVAITDADTPFAAVAGSVVTADATAGVITVDLPDAAASKGQTVTVIKTDASANAITVAAADNINGAASTPLAAQYNTLTAISDGSTWLITAQL